MVCNPAKGRVDLCGWMVEICAKDLWLEATQDHKFQWKRKNCHTLAMLGK
jgi:hypothetical protein